MRTRHGRIVAAVVPLFVAGAAAQAADSSPKMADSSVRAADTSARPTAREDSTQIDRRSGPYVSLGIAYGLRSETCDMCASASTGGLSGYVAFGETTSSHTFRVGFEADIWDGKPGSDTVRVVFQTLAVAYYPSLTNNLWFRGNIGWTSSSVRGAGGTTKSSGFALGVGVGFDWFPGRSSFAIIPFAAAFQQISAGGGDARERLIAIGAEIGYKH